MTSFNDYLQLISSTSLKTTGQFSYANGIWQVSYNFFDTAADLSLAGYDTIAENGDFKNDSMEHANWEPLDITQKGMFQLAMGFNNLEYSAFFSDVIKVEFLSEAPNLAKVNVGQIEFDYNGDGRVGADDADGLPDKPGAVAYTYGDASTPSGFFADYPYSKAAGMQTMGDIWLNKDSQWNSTVNGSWEWSTPNLWSSI